MAAAARCLRSLSRSTNAAKVCAVQTSLDPLKTNIQTDIYFLCSIYRLASPRMRHKVRVNPSGISVIFKITDPPKILLFFLCIISTISAMCQNINVEATETVDVTQRGNDRVLGGSIIIIPVDTYGNH